MFDKISTGRYWDKPWSLVSGCTPCSPGCAHCWALAMEKRFRPQERVTVHPERLDIPLRRKKPTVWAIWNDLFHEDVPRQFQNEALGNMIDSPNHIFLILTKRPQRMLEFMRWATDTDYNLKNIWLGVTVCNQEEADEKIPVLLQIPAAVRWISIEPMLGPIDLDKTCGKEWCWRGDLDWVVLGGEGGPGARPLDPQWVESVRDQCVAAGVPFFFKSWGEWRGNYPGDSWEPDGMQSYYFPRIAGPKAWRCGKKSAGRLLDGREWTQLPEGEK